MRTWRQITVGDRLIAVDADGEPHEVVAHQVPKERRDTSGSHATTTFGVTPKAWVAAEGAEPVPWPCADLHWPAQWAARVQG